ncbi:MAG: hypothetical protein JO372_04670 [Solirubrobacterales bacterium]|nr:hypothetical protein [Solirubrobacterales bacterium]
MAVAVHIIPEQMSRQDYEQVIRQLESSGAGDPEGRKFHAAYGKHEDVHMFEVWDSAEQFDAHRGRLVEILQAAGVDCGTIDVHPLHSEHPD